MLFIFAVVYMLPLTAFGQASSLGSATNFVLFSSSGAVTNTGLSLLTGNPAAVFIFQVQGAFSTNPSSRVVLIKGAKAAMCFGNPKV